MFFENVTNGVFWGFSGVCCTSFRNFEDAWRSYGTDEDILFVFKDSWWRFSHIFLLSSQVLGARSAHTRARTRIRNSGMRSLLKQILSHCGILMSAVAHRFGATASWTELYKFQDSWNENWMNVGNHERKGTSRTKCAHLMYFVWHWMPHHLSFLSFFWVLRILSTGNLGICCILRVSGNELPPESHLFCFWKSVSRFGIVALF